MNTGINLSGKDILYMREYIPAMMHRMELRILISGDGPKTLMMIFVGRKDMMKKKMNVRKKKLAR